MKFYDDDNNSALIHCECSCNDQCHPGVVHVPGGKVKGE